MLIEFIHGVYILLPSVHSSLINWIAFTNSFIHSFIIFKAHQEPVEERRLDAHSSKAPPR